MADWRIHSPRNPDWQCHLADCDEDHAYSVMDSLRQDPHCPEYLEIENLTPEPEPFEGEAEIPPIELSTPVLSLPDPEPDPEPEPRKRLFSWRHK